MSEDLVVAHCAPTLAGLKTGSLFVCPKESLPVLRESLRSLNRRFGEKGIRVLPLKELKRGILIYLYRPRLLEADLRDPLAERLLRERAYPLTTATRPWQNWPTACAAGWISPMKLGSSLVIPRRTWRAS